MKIRKKQCFSMLLCVILAVSLMTSAFAADIVTIKDKNDARISAMLNAIDQQNFDDASINAEQAKKYVSHYLFDSEFAGIGGGNFKYPNSASNYFTNITDGTYSQKIFGSKGCCAYSRYISQVFYGTDGENKGQVLQFKNYGEQKTADELKDFLKKYAQAGEHFRIYKWHSLSLISCDDNGFYALSYSGSATTDYGGAPIQLRYFTYAAFLNKYSKGRIELYNANPSVNGAKPKCAHSYNSLGVCDQCGEAYAYTVTKTNFNVTIVDKAYVQSKPYGNSAYYVSTLSNGATAAVTGTTKNHYGNTWYQLANGNWVYSERCKTVAQKPTLTISGEVSPSGALTLGSNFGLRGTISTDCGKITSVTGSILDASGKTVSGQSKTYTPNATSFNIRSTINNDLIFNKLSAGSYTYYVKAVAQNGNESAQLTISRKFTVGAAAQCEHSYNSLGVCDQCGEAYPYTVKKASFNVTIVDKAYVQSKPYGNSAYYLSTLSDGTTVAVTGTTENHYGNTWYQLANGNWISSDRCKTVTQKPTITISGEVSPSGTLTLGSNFGLRGVISTDCGVITSVSGYILDSSGSRVSGQSGYYTPNTTTFNIRSTINNDLIFNKLSAGSYTYYVKAVAENGSESAQLTISRKFTIEAEEQTASVSYEKPTITISGEVSPSGALTLGSNFGLRGTISTDCGVITSVNGYIQNSKTNNTVDGQKGYYTPNAASVNIRSTINNDLIFENLSIGSYKYCLFITAVNGTETSELTIIRPFTVEAPAGATYQKPTVTISGEVSPSGTLTRGSNFGLRGTISTDCGKIIVCRGYILEVVDGESVIRQRCEYTPNAASINIRTTINNNLIFDKLPAGSYKYYVLAVAENGTESTTFYFSRPFSVG